MKSVGKCLLSLIVTISCLIAGCASPQETGTEKVWITLHGEVVKEGKVAIGKTFTKDSIIEAGGGWDYGSNFRLAPNSFTLQRVTSGQTNVWKLRFREMQDQKWKGFEFHDGDDIWVHKRFF